jgi:hypothetical protein
MARPKTPTSILDARGAFKKDPGRARPKEPSGNGVLSDLSPALPLELTHLFSQELFDLCWDELHAQIPAGVATGTDYTTFYLCVEMLATHKAVGLSDGRFSKLITLMGKFGLNPSDRAGLVVDKKEADPFDAILSSAG